MGKRIPVVRDGESVAEATAREEAEEAAAVRPPKPELVVERDQPEEEQPASAPVVALAPVPQNLATRENWSNGMEEIDLDRINPGANFRKTFRLIDELLASIKSVGLLHALIVRPLGNGYELVCGERRLVAVTKWRDDKKEPGPRTVRCDVRVLSDREADELRLAENLKRDDLTPLEEAAGFARMRDVHKMSEEEIAAKFGVSRTTVRNRLLLLALGPEARAALEGGEINTSVAVMVAARPEHKVQAQMVERAKQKNALTHEAAAELFATEFAYELAKAPFDRKDEFLLPAAGACAKCPHNTTNQRTGDGGKPPRADVCTGPTCYADKVKESLEQAKAKAKEAGKTWLSVADAKAAFQGQEEVPASSAYVGLDQVAWEDLKKKRTWRQLLGKEGLSKLKLFVGATGRGFTHELVLKAEAAAAARDQGTLGEKQAEQAARDPKAERKQLDEEADLQEAVAVKVLAAGVAEAEKGLTPTLLRVMATAMLAAGGGGTVLERRGRSAEQLTKDLAKMKEGALQGLVFELAVAESVEGGTPMVGALARVLELDRKKLERETQAELKLGLDGKTQKAAVEPDAKLKAKKAKKKGEAA